MQQGGRNGATKPPFRARKGALTSVVSKALPFSNKKKMGAIWRTMPNLQNRIPHQRAERLFFFWARPMQQGGRNGATKPPFRARKGALTSDVFKALPFSNKKNWEIWRKCPIYKTESRINVPSDFFFSGLGQCTKAGAMGPPSHLCVRERTRLLVLFPRFDFSNKKIGGNVQKNARSTKPNSTSTCRANIFFWARPMHQDKRESVTGKLLSAGRSSRQV